MEEVRMNLESSETKLKNRMRVSSFVVVVWIILVSHRRNIQKVQYISRSSHYSLHNKETIFENDEALKGVKSANRARARNLESRIAELELNLEEETEIRTEHEKVAVLLNMLFYFEKNFRKNVSVFQNVHLNPPNDSLKRLQGLKRLERVVKDLELQAMEDTQSIERQVEQITNLNNRNKQLKSQFADSVSSLFF